MSYHLRIYLVIDDLLRQMINHQWEIVEKTHAHGAVRTAEEPDNHRGDLPFILFIRELLTNPHHQREDLGTSAAKLNRFEQFRQHLHLEEIFRKVICFSYSIKFAFAKSAVSAESF